MRQGINPVGARVLVLGLTFKENCPDLRNTRVVDIITTLREYNVAVDVCDPWVDPREAEEEHGITPLTEAKERGVYQGVILAVPHREFLAAEGESVRALGAENSVLFDVKSVLPAGTATLRL